MKSFTELPLTPPILKSLERMEYSTPTDVQAKTIPLVIDGRDVLVTAQTGTGKTAAFAVPILQRMIAALDADEPIKRALILAPTRELAEQIGLVLRELTFFFRRIRYTVIIGGAPYGKQFRELGMSPAFVVGTPGRLIDHIDTKTLDLKDFDVLVLDESDRMLDMGFAPQIEMIVKSFPTPRQTMMFSATLPQEVRGLVAKYLKNPARVAIGEENSPVAKIKQDVIELRDSEKMDRLLLEIDGMAGSMIIFTKTRLKADVVASMLSDSGHKAEALHGDLTQRERRQVTNRFRESETRILVATDIASRGLDIEHVRHVVNFDLPMVPEDYIHRIGRTGRNGNEGHSIAFVTQNERQRWNQILRLMGGGQAPSGKAGRQGYKGSETRSAFSGRDGNDRTKPFAKPFDGMAKPKKFVKPEKRGARGAGGGKATSPFARKPKSDRVSPDRRVQHGGYMSDEAKAVREDYKAREETQVQRKAEKFGRTSGFKSPRPGVPAPGGGAPTARPSFSERYRQAISPGPQLAPGAKPHKGKADTRKRKSVSHYVAAKKQASSSGSASPSRPPARGNGGKSGSHGGSQPPRRRR